MQKKSIETILYSTVGVVVMALILIAFNFLTGAVRQRVDLTEDKAYTLSDGTRAILKKLDTPVKIRFYCTQSSSPELVGLRDYARRVEDLLAEYKQIAGDKLVIEKLDPQPDSNAEDSARLDGIEGKDLPNGEKFYLGLAVGVLDEKQAIAFLDPSRERLLEYDLSRAITRVETPERPVVGIMTPLPVFGSPMNPMMMQMGRQGQEPPWTIITELKNDYTVKRVDMDTDKIDDDVKVLVVIHPRDITDKAQYAIDQFILRGGKLLAFLDAQSIVDTPPQQQQDPMSGMASRSSSLDKLLKAWGLQFDTGKVVADMNFKMQLNGRDGQPTDAPAFLSVTPDGINPNDVVTGPIQSIWLPFAGAFTGKPAEGLKETILLKSTTDSQLVDGLMAKLSGESILKDFKSSGVTYALSVRLDGKFKTAFPKGKPEDEKKDADKKDEPASSKTPDDSLKESKADNTVILVGDADMLFDQVALRTMQTPFGNYATELNGNFNFAQNAVEQLAGNSSLIAVRSRAVQSHPFTRIKTMLASAEEASRARMKNLEDSLVENQQRLTELQQGKQGAQKFILSPEQQAEMDKVRKKVAEANKNLKEERKKLRQDIDSMQGRLKWWNIAAMPAVVSLSGVVLAIYKRKRTAAK